MKLHLEEMEALEAQEPDRISWDTLWMEFALLVAKRSHHPTFKVGCVIVSHDNTRVLSIGYNGDFSSGPNKPVSDIPGCSDLIHAETNALLKLDYHATGARTLYTTLSPCLMCAKRILNSRIDRVVYKEEYRNSQGLELLEKHVTINKWLK